MNIHHNTSNNKMTAASSTSKTTMMRSTALIIFLVHIMYISFARGFILPSTSSSSLQHRHNALYATRQDDMLTTGYSRAFTTTSPATPRRRRRPTPSSTTNNNNQYTQFFKESVLVGIERTSPNSRRISGEMIMNIPVDTIWNILTDYDNLSVHVPNLVESKVISTRGTSPRVYQRGAQRIFGFEFGADVTMDMMEHVHLVSSSSTTAATAVDDEGTSKQCVIDFKCVDSQFFSEFDGSWIVEEYKDEDGVSPPSSSSSGAAPITMVRYVVDVRPKGPVPVAALEWRIKEDVPVNILAVSKAATAAMARHQTEQRQQQQSVIANVVPQVPRSTQPPSTPLSSPRRRRSPRQATLQPLQRLTNQAANNFKRTAKSVLPSPLYSSAKQAVNMINNNLPRPRRNDAPTMSLQTGNDTGSDFKTETTLASSASKDMDVDWYDDETMAMYL